MSFRDGFIEEIDSYGAWHRVASFRAICRHLHDLLADDAFCARFEQAWRGHTFAEPWHRPLLVIDLLRFDALLTGEDHPLWSALAAAPPREDAVTRGALASALDASRKRFWRELQQRSVQTNETSRALVWLWPAHLAGCSGGMRDLALLDVGASAGLNLVCDSLPCIWPSGNGFLPIVEQPRVLLRLGIDRNPLDCSVREDAAWLRACIWPTDEARLARLEAAMNAWRDAQNRADPPRVERGDIREAPALLEIMARELPQGALILAYQSLTKEYLDLAGRAQYEQGMRAWLASLPPKRGLWVEMENADKPQAPYYVAVTAHFNTGKDIASLELGRCGFHPTDLAVNTDAVAAFKKAWKD